MSDADTTTNGESADVNRTDLISVPDHVSLESDEARLLDRLAGGTECAGITVYDDDPLHFSYYDKGRHPKVNNSALMLVQESGYALLHCGATEPPEGGEEVGWFEAKPRAYYEENFWD